MLAHLPPARAAYLTGRSFFPNLISGPFSSGLHEAFDFAIAACLIAAVASWLRGKPSARLDPEPAVSSVSVRPSGPVRLPAAGPLPAACPVASR